MASAGIGEALLGGAVTMAAIDAAHAVHQRTDGGELGICPPCERPLRLRRSHGTGAGEGICWSVEWLELRTQAPRVTDRAGASSRRYDAARVRRSALRRGHLRPLHGTRKGTRQRRAMCRGQTDRGASAVMVYLFSAGA